MVQIFKSNSAILKRSAESEYGQNSVSINVRYAYETTR